MLYLETGDLRLEETRLGGYFLYIKKKPAIKSVLLVESTQDPNFQGTQYAYRNPNYDKTNGDELRLLDGDPLVYPLSRYALIDSTPEMHAEMGEVFKIFIPYTIVYGYPWNRNGYISVKDGTYLNLRTFASPYADYRNNFVDNPFIVRVKQVENTEKIHLTTTVEDFEDIARDNRGVSYVVQDSNEMMQRIVSIIKEHGSDNMDIAFVIDASESMKAAFSTLEAQISTELATVLQGVKNYRIAVIFYRDYQEAFVRKIYGFSPDINSLYKRIQAMNAAGGKDIPEAVDEALYAGARILQWEGTNRIVILIGDAPAHKIPRGPVSRADINKMALQQGLRIYTLALPQ